MTQSLVSHGVNTLVVIMLCDGSVEAVSATYPQVLSGPLKKASQEAQALGYNRGQSNEPCPKHQFVSHSS